jgi:hypothetical protein
MEQLLMHALKACRIVFGNVKAMFMKLEKNYSEPLAKVLHALYDSSLYHGAHPNPSSLLSNIAMSETETGIEASTSYLNPEPLLLCLRHNAQSGVAVLKVFNLVFPDRFTEVGADVLIAQASQGL